ncbi:MAG: Gx transporter family protein [Lachnospiraceae bacterium]|nr:Gx transporter family protein [Lachnospiraceae bacterium]
MDRPSMNKNISKRLALLALLTACAIIMGYVEALLPLDFVIPGVKPGLCNIVILITLIMFSWREALLVSFVRILAVGFMFGNLFSISYSTAGTVFAVFIMAVLLNTGRSGLLGISASGGAMHGIGQMMVAKLVLPALPFAGYASILILSGTVTGALVGLISYEMLKRVYSSGEYMW